jgi:hypothetical protein
VIWLILLLGCAAHIQRTGLVVLEDGDPQLVTLDGEQTRLVLEGEALAVAALQGCIVVVSGRKRSSGLHVEQWSVQDAAFGTQPFVGRLRRVGEVLLLEDRTTSTTIRLDLSHTAGLEEAVGGIVLIEGIIVGPQVLRVMSWRGLLAPGAERPGPG